MRNTWLVFKHDTLVILQQRSFWVLTLMVPLLMVGLGLSRSMGEDGDAGSTPPEPAEQGAGSQELPVLGLVDRAGLLRDVPPDIPDVRFVRFAGLEAALAALKDGQVRQVVEVPADFVARGEVTVYAQNFQIQIDGGDGSLYDRVLPALIRYNLTGDARVAAALDNPTPGGLARHHRLAPVQAGPETDSAAVELVSSYLPYLFYFLLVLSSSSLIRSVIAEKENRTAEVLLLSLPPRQLMAGKILMGSAIMVLQLLLWGVSWALLLNRDFSALDFSAFQFPPGFFLWAGVYLVLGYLLFAAVMAAGGALATNPREIGQITFLLILPLMPTLMFGSYFIENPDSPLTIGLSLFPFSSPSVMVTRLAFGPAPLWQLLASLALLAGTAYLFLVLAGRFFQVGNLLSEEPFRWARLLVGWRGEEA